MSGFWKNKSVLVTGAGGFISSHLVESLHEQGAHVRAFGRYFSCKDSGAISILPSQVLANLEVNIIRTLNMHKMAHQPGPEYSSPSLNQG